MLEAALAQAQEKIENLETASASNNDTELQYVINAVLSDLHTYIALSEDYMRNQDLKLEILSSVAKCLNIAVEQANKRTENAMRSARDAYKAGFISHESLVETEEHLKDMSQSVLARERTHHLVNCEQASALICLL